MCTAVSFGIISQFRGSWPLGWILLHRWPLWPFARNWTSIEKIEPGSCWRSGFKVEIFFKKIWYFVSKIDLVIEKKYLKFRGWKPRICKIFEITRTIFSNSERSEQFLVTECFFNLFLVVSQIRTIRINYWDLETCRKS